MSPSRRSLHSFANHGRTAVLGMIAACTALSASAFAQVRREPNVASTLTRDDAQLGASLFARKGDFLIAGGVVLHGRAAFLLEQGGHTVSVPAAEVAPVAEPGGMVALRYAGQTYQVGMPAGLACPLGRFVARHGLIAYTVVHFMDEDSPRSLQKAGLVRRRLAREFDGSGFEKLLRAADFAETEKLPDGVGAGIASSINGDNGIGAFLINTADGDDGVGSYVNSDFQVTYRVFLMAGQGRAEIAGVPLRYFWQLDRSGAAGVFSVEALAQNWPQDAHLTQVAAKDSPPSQYDVTNFYQVAGLLRQLELNSPPAFGRFVTQICGS